MPSGYMRWQNTDWLRLEGMGFGPAPLWETGPSRR